MTERLWVRAPTVETIFQAPFNWIKAWNKICGKTLTWHCCICCNPANGRVDFVEWLAYKIQLHGNEWIVSLSADWDQSPKKKKKKKKKNVESCVTSRTDDSVSRNQNQWRGLAFNQSESRPAKLRHRNRRRDVQQQSHWKLLRTQHCQ